MNVLEQYVNENRRQTKSKCCSSNITQRKINILLNTKQHWKDQDKAT